MREDRVLLVFARGERSLNPGKSPMQTSPMPSTPRYAHFTAGSRRLNCESGFAMDLKLQGTPVDGYDSCCSVSTLRSFKELVSHLITHYNPL